MWKYLLTPNRHYKVTPILFYANALVFIAMVISGTDPVTPQVADLVNWGGNTRSFTLDGELWRLVSCLFVHAGILHLLFNGYALLYIGSQLEHAIGSNKYFFGYFFTGLTASIASLVYNVEAVSIGASGAIFGLFGIMLPLLYFKALRIPPQARQGLLSSILFFVILNTVIGFSAGIDNAAHIGGLIGGLVYGSLLCLPRLRHTMSLPVILTIALGVGVFQLNQYLANPIKDYQNVMQVFMKNERTAQWLHKLGPVPNDETEKEILIEKIKSQNIALWQQNVDLLVQLTNLPERLAHKVKLLEQYSKTRIQSSETLIQIIRYNRANDEAKFIRLNKQTLELLEKINHS